MAEPRTFQAGGTVREGSTYVERRADKEIVDALLEGEFCYVLAPRQIGKSSLRLRAQQALRQKGIRCASVDLTSIGTSGITDDEWYFGLVEEIGSQLEVGRDPADFWAKRASLAPIHRFSHFLRDEVLGGSDARVVICIDEIDAVLALPFAGDDFFAAIRAAYNKRAEDPTFARLTFCIFGVATPAELIQDATRTPFNIGRAIRLLDFTRAEADALLPGLEGHGDARALLDAVLDWTSGHPYMTQRVCMALTQTPAEEGQDVKDRVDALVDRLFLQRGRTEEPNLAYAEKRLKKADEAMRTRMLRIYRRLLHGEEIAVKGDDPAELELRLAGLVSDRAGGEGAPALVIRNKVVAHVFGIPWVNENDSSNPLAEPVAMWLQWKRGDDFLLRGAALDVALAWAKGRQDLSPEEHEFLRASALSVERRDAAWQRRKLAMVVAALLVLVVFLVTAVLLYRSALAAEQRATEAAQDAQKDAEQRLSLARADLEARVQQAADAQKDAENRAQEAATRAAKAQQSADELEKVAQSTQNKSEAEEAKKKADDAKQEALSAYQRAAQERQLAFVAQDLAAKAASAAKGASAGGTGADKVNEKTIQSEQAAREVHDEQIALERAARQQAEKELSAKIEQLRACNKDKDALSKDANRLLPRFATPPPNAPAPPPR